jgi:hypothetical protein
MWKTLLLTSLMIVPLALFAAPPASAYPCDVNTGEFGVGVICDGPGAIGFCAIELYDTNFVQWANPGGVVCL